MVVMVVSDRRLAMSGDSAVTNKLHFLEADHWIDVGEKGARRRINNILPEPR